VKLQPIGSLRHGIPPRVRKMVSSLTDAIPGARPAAPMVANAFHSSLRNHAAGPIALLDPTALLRAGPARRRRGPFWRVKGSPARKAASC
jgi:hypothetical protein